MNPCRLWRTQMHWYYAVSLMIQVKTGKSVYKGLFIMHRFVYLDNLNFILLYINIISIFNYLDCRRSSWLISQGCLHLLGTFVFSFSIFKFSFYFFFWWKSCCSDYNYNLQIILRVWCHDLSLYLCIWSCILLVTDW